MEGLEVIYCSWGFIPSRDLILKKQWIKWLSNI